MISSLLFIGKIQNYLKIWFISIDPLSMILILYTHLIFSAFGITQEDCNKETLKYLKLILPEGNFIYLPKYFSMEEMKNYPGDNFVVGAIRIQLENYSTEFELLKCLSHDPQMKSLSSFGKILTKRIAFLNKSSILLKSTYNSFFMENDLNKLNSLQEIYQKRESERVSSLIRLIKFYHGVVNCPIKSYLKSFRGESSEYLNSKDFLTKIKLALSIQYEKSWDYEKKLLEQLNLFLQQRQANLLKRSNSLKKAPLKQTNGQVSALLQEIKKTYNWPTVKMILSTVPSSRKKVDLREQIKALSNAQLDISKGKLPHLQKDTVISTTSPQPTILEQELSKESPEEKMVNPVKDRLMLEPETSGVATVPFLVRGFSNEGYDAFPISLQEPMPPIKPVIPPKPNFNFEKVEWGERVVKYSPKYDFFNKGSENTVYKLRDFESGNLNGYLIKIPIAIEPNKKYLEEIVTVTNQLREEGINVPQTSLSNTGRLIQEKIEGLGTVYSFVQKPLFLKNKITFNCKFLNTWNNLIFFQLRNKFKAIKDYHVDNFIVDPNLDLFLVDFGLIKPQTNIILGHLVGLTSQFSHLFSERGDRDLADALTTLLEKQYKIHHRPFLFESVEKFNFDLDKCFTYKNINEFLLSQIPK